MDKFTKAYLEDIITEAGKAAKVPVKVRCTVGWCWDADSEEELISIYPDDPMFEGHYMFVGEEGDDPDDDDNYELADCDIAMQQGLADRLEENGFPELTPGGEAYGDGLSGTVEFEVNVPYGCSDEKLEEECVKYLEREFGNCGEYYAVVEDITIEKLGEEGGKPIHDRVRKNMVVKEDPFQK